MNKMDLIKVESNWTASSPLQNLLITTNKQGASTNRTECNDCVITLTQPTTADGVRDACHITLNCSRLQGQHPISVSLISGARNIECYIGQDDVYVDTNRGTFVRLSDNDRERYGRLYWCVNLLPEHTSFVTLKLPSLKGSCEVVLNKISVILSDINEGGVSDNLDTTNGVLQPQVDDVFSMLQRSDNVPPFLTTLLTALKTSSVSSDNVGELSAMFRQIRKQDTPPPQDTPPHQDSPKEEAPQFGDNETDNENNMETRITKYIDKKFLEFRHHFDNQLLLMKKEITNEINKK